MPKMQEHFSASLRHNFGGRREGPSMALHSSIGHPAQLPPKIMPPLGQKKGLVLAATLVDERNLGFHVERLIHAGCIGN